MAAASAPPSPRKPGGPGQPWSDVETAHLISAYAEKWYSLKRGPLKAQQWEDVAAAVASRCGLRTPSRNGTQCRHKMEKLRKRYRAERKLLPAPSRWPHFHLMDRMERGTLDVSPPDDDAGSNDEASEGPEEDEDDYPVGLNNGNADGHGMRMVGGSWGFNAPRDGDDAGRGGLAAHLATSVTRFAQQFQRIEKRRMEMMAELERNWMEMETRKMQMLAESHHYLVDAVASATAHSSKRLKRSL